MFCKILSDSFGLILLKDFFCWGFAIQCCIKRDYFFLQKKRASLCYLGRHHHSYLMFLGSEKFLKCLNRSVLFFFPL